MKHTFLILILMLPGLLIAQAIKFAENIISNNAVFGLALTPDGKTAYFVNSRGGRDTMTLAVSHFKKGKWQRPQPLAFAHQPGIWKDIDPFMSIDGKTLIFNSTRPYKPNQGKNDFDIWAVRRTKKGWSEPYPLEGEINSDSSDAYATMARNGNIYFGSNRAGGFGRFDIYVSEFKNGTYQIPINLGANINTSGHDSNPYISPDEDFLIFSGSEELGGYGDSDLYISFKINGIWTKSENLGLNINTSIAEFCPLMIPGRNIIYFSRLQRGKPFIENIYQTPLNIEEFRKNKILYSLL